MKKIEAIIRQEKVDDLKGALFQKTKVSGITVHQVLGCGQQLGLKEYVRGQEMLSTLLPKVEITIVVLDEELEDVINVILENCRTQEVGDGKIFVYDVQEAIRVRTGERGEEAIK